MGKIYLLNNLKYEGIENLEVFKIEYMKKDVSLNFYDALIFTSKNAVLSLDSFNKHWKKIPSYAISEKTANQIKQLNGNISFVGFSGHGNDFAQELIPLLKNKKVLYIRAEEVISDLFKILNKENIQIDELVTYKTICNNKINKKLEKNSVIIFTSPSSIKCFFKKYAWDSSYKVVVIGKTTAKYMPKNIKYKISPKSAIDECIKLAQTLIFNLNNI